jgi:hypothetical protein
MLLIVFLKRHSLLAILYSLHTYALVRIFTFKYFSKNSESYVEKNIEETNHTQTRDNYVQVWEERAQWVMTNFIEQSVNKQRSNCKGKKPSNQNTTINNKKQRQSGSGKRV